MDSPTYLNELRRMAAANGIWLSKESQVVSLTHYPGARFINVLKGDDKSHLLVVTSEHVFSLRTQLMGVKVLWQVALGDVSDVRTTKGTFRGYVIHSLVVDAGGDSFEFRFGFNRPDFTTQTSLEIAAHNAELAAGEIADAVAARRPPPPSVAGERESRFARLYAFINSVRPLGSLDMVGRPFGEGLDLESVVAAARSFLIDGDDVRNCDHMIAIDLLVATGSSFQPEDLDMVMGATADAARRYGLTQDQVAAVTSLTGAAKAFLGQFETEGADMWELWLRRDDVALEFLAWHTLARLRLAAAGRMEPVSTEPPT